MKFKQIHLEQQYEMLPSKLKEICEYFAKISINHHGVMPVVTRILDPVAGESGVHQAYRAVDFRNQFYVGNSPRFLYPMEVVEIIVDDINTKYPRKDGKLVCIHHSFKGGPFHWHLQIPIEWVTKEERGRIYGTVV